MLSVFYFHRPSVSPDCLLSDFFLAKENLNRFGVRTARKHPKICLGILSYYFNSCPIHCSSCYDRIYMLYRFYPVPACVLVLSVMVVFLLSEVPRLYINSTIFFTYRTDLEKNENIAFDKMRSVINTKKTITCDYHNNEEAQLNIPNYNSCTFDDLPSTLR